MRETAMTGTSPRIMPLIHMARHSYRNWIEGFAIENRIAELQAAYLRSHSDRLADLLKVEIDLLETLI